MIGQILTLPLSGVQKKLPTSFIFDTIEPPTRMDA